MSEVGIDPKWFRQVLSQYPTGVCIVTGQAGDQSPIGLTIGSFTSVSLDPPLVGFLPGRASRSWKALESTGRFCINILGADQESICRQFASPTVDKFQGVGFRLSPNGSPILADCVAWIDCDLASVADAGDHLFVLGKVRELQIESAGLPLLFYQGGYGRFIPLSMAAPDPLGKLSEQLRQVDLARPEMERISEDLSARCVATAHIGDEIIMLASAGATKQGSPQTMVGQRIPFAAPVGSVFAAWSGDSARETWIEQAPPNAREACRAMLTIIRERGYSIVLVSEAYRIYVKLADGELQPSDVDLRSLANEISYEPVSLPELSQGRMVNISVPIFDAANKVAFVISMLEIPIIDSPEKLLARTINLANIVTDILMKQQ